MAPGSLNSVVAVGFPERQIYSTFLLLIPLLLWRLWKFTLLPALRPSDPKEVPYWIPFLGHGIGFFKDSQNAITSGREYFGNTREPYAMTVTGQTFYVLTASKDVSSVYKNTKSFDFDVFVRDLMLWFGASVPAADKMYERPTSQLQGGHPNPKNKCLAKLVVDFHHHQLLPGKEADILGSSFLRLIEENLRWDKIATNQSYILDVSADSAHVSLLRLCADVLVDAGTRAYFGDDLNRIAPDLPHSFRRYDETAWKLLFQYPRLFSRDMHAAKAEVLDALVRYFELPRTERSGECWFNRTFETELRLLEMSNEDIAAFMAIIYWAINTNTFKSCFWMLAYILQDPAKTESIRNEVAPGVQDGTINIHHLMDQCPQLGAAYHEILRLCSSSTSIRYITETTEIGGKKIRKGNKLLIPYRELHHNHDVYGENTFQFDADRFLVNKELNRDSSYRPFGGGSSLCPGRFIAKQEVVTFVALVLYKYDMKLSLKTDEQGRQVPQPFPKVDAWKPTLGVLAPAPGNDLVVQLKRSRQ